MSSLILPRRFTQQGDSNFLEINGENPLARELAFAWSPMQGRVAVTSKNRLLCNTYAVSSSAKTGRQAVKCVAGQKNIEWDNHQPILTSYGEGTGAFTMMVCADPEAAGGGAVEHVFAQKNDAGGSPYAQAILAAHADSTAAYSSGRFSFFVYNGGTSIGASAASLCDGLPHQWTGVRSGTTYTLYKDGDVAATNTGSAVAITQNPSRYLALGSRGNGTTEAYRDRLYYAFAWNRALTQAEISTIYSDPYSLFNKRKAKTVVYFGGAGAGTNLAIQDASHAHAAEPPVLTTEWLLSIADAASAHLADAPTLTTDSVLAVAEALHAHVADSLGLTADSLLAVQDAAHVHAADNVVLDTSNATQLTLQDAAHTHAADNPTLTTDTWLAIAETVHANLADGVTLTTAQTLAILEAMHAHAAESLVLFFSSFTPDQLAEIFAYVEANMPTPAQYAAAVWSQVLEGALTAEQMQRILLASLAGKRAGLGTATEEYMGVDGVTPRVTFTPTDSSGNGSTVLDGS